MRKFILFLNRNAMVFDENGEQDVAAQRTVSCYHVNKKAAQKVLDGCDSFEISSWREWIHPTNKRCIEYLLGLRTRKRDMEEEKL